MHILQRMSLYIHQQADWPNFYWESNEVIKLLSEARHLQGRLLGKMESMEIEIRNDALLDNYTLDTVKSSEIEGEKLEPAQVRSSVARKLGLEKSAPIVYTRDVDGMVEMMLDATNNCFEELSAQRLFNWHSSLFPSGRSGIIRIKVGCWRGDVKGPMQVVSGSVGREKVHFEAPASFLLPKEMQVFLKWYNGYQDIDPVLKAAVAHLWFITIHPFEDGNGRIARAITDGLLARSENNNQRFYSMSAQIRVDRKQYYSILEKTQKGNLDITEWMKWFLCCLINAIKSTEGTLSHLIIKDQFWNEHSTKQLNQRQMSMLNKILDGFKGKVTSAKWAKINKVSKDTAIRDINDLIEKNILQKEDAGGRSTSYELIWLK